MTNKDPQNIGPIIADLIKKMGFEKKLSEVDAVGLWDEIVGEKIARVTQAVKITNGRLHIRVSDPAWRQQLVFLKREFISSINARMGKNVVKDIYLT